MIFRTDGLNVTKLAIIIILLQQLYRMGEAAIILLGFEITAIITHNLMQRTQLKPTVKHRTMQVIVDILVELVEFV